MGCLKAIRWFFSTILIVLLLIVIIIGIPLAAISSVATDRTFVKGWLRQSSVYDNAMDLATQLILDQASTSPADGQSGDTGEGLNELLSQITDETSDTGKFISENFDSAFFERATNTVIDGFYDWLEGVTERPTFEISLVDSNEDLITLLSAGFEEKMAGLPVCDMESLPSPETSPLEYTCVPEGFDPATIDEYLRSMEDAPEFDQLMQSTKITSDTFQIDEQTTKDARTTFKVLQYLPKIVLASGIVLVVLLVLLIPGMKAKFLTPAFVMLIPSAILAFAKLFGPAIISQVYSFMLQQLGTDTGAISNQSFELIQTIVTRLFEAAANDIGTRIFIYSMIAISVSALLIAIAIITALLSHKKEESPPQPPVTNTATTVSSSQQSTPTQVPIATKATTKPTSFTSQPTNK